MTLEQVEISAASDRPHVETILAESAANGEGLRDLIKLVVMSQPFRSK